MRTYTQIIAVVLAAVLQAMTQAQLPPPTAKKPPVGVPADAKLFNGKWYKVIFEKVSWPSARDKCRALGGQLVVIPDETTYVFVKALTPVKCWLGATDEKTEGAWMWVDGTLMTFTAWYPGEPNNEGNSEDYLGILKGQWNDHPRTHESIVGYICEWKDK